MNSIHLYMFFYTICIIIIIKNGLLSIRLCHILPTCDHHVINDDTMTHAMQDIYQSILSIHLPTSKNCGKNNKRLTLLILEP